jgi:hypothetical protein
MSRHAQRANQFGAVGDAVAAGNQVAYRRRSVTQVSTGRLIMCTPPLGRPAPKFTLLLRVPRQLRSVIPIRIRDKFIQVQLIPIRNSLKKLLIALLPTKAASLRTRRYFQPHYTFVPSTACAAWHSVETCVNRKTERFPPLHQNVKSIVHHVRIRRQ